MTSSHRPAVPLIATLVRAEVADAIFAGVDVDPITAACFHPLHGAGDDIGSRAAAVQVVTRPLTPGPAGGADNT